MDFEKLKKHIFSILKVAIAAAVTAFVASLANQIQGVNINEVTAALMGAIGYVSFNKPA